MARSPGIAGVAAGASDQRPSANATAPTIPPNIFARRGSQRFIVRTLHEPPRGSGGAGRYALWSSRSPQATQKVLRDRRNLAWVSPEQPLATMFLFTTSPQVGQWRTVTTERP